MPTHISRQYISPGDFARNKENSSVCDLQSMHYIVRTFASQNVIRIDAAVISLGRDIALDCITGKQITTYIYREKSYIIIILYRRFPTVSHRFIGIIDISHPANLRIRRLVNVAKLKVNIV